MSPTLPVDYLCAVAVAVVGSAMLTPRPRTAALTRVVGWGVRIVDAITGRVPRLRDRGLALRGGASVLVLLALRALGGSALERWLG